MTLVGRQRVGNADQSVPRLAGPDRSRFVREFGAPERPVVVEGGLERWPALGKWTPRFFARVWGHLDLDIDGRKLRMSDFVARVEDPEARAPYVKAYKLDTLAPELLDDLLPEPALMRPNWLDGRFITRRSSIRDVVGYGSRWELLFGKPGSLFPVLHWDTKHLHAFICQLYGTKEVVVYGPDQTPYLYPREDRPNQSHLPVCGDVDLGVFPEFSKARGASTTLSAGDLLFIPSGWWHAVENSSVSIAVTRNVANRTNWRAVIGDVTSQWGTPLRSRVMAGYLRSVGLLRTILRQ